MKTPINMLEHIAGQITENLSLLEFIFRNSPDMGETDNALSCLIRSMLKTSEEAQEYIDMYISQSPPSGNNSDIADDVFYATLSAAKLRELVHVYNESYFSEKSSDDPDCLMAAVIFDHAIKTHEVLKSIEAKLS